MADGLPRVTYGDWLSKIEGYKDPPSYKEAISSDNNDPELPTYYQACRKLGDEAQSSKLKETIFTRLQFYKERAEKIRKILAGRDFQRKDESTLNDCVVRDSIGNVK